MTGAAILTMVLTMGTVIAFMIYFFLKILRAPLPTDEPEPRPNADSPGDR
jgi:hypothetical protein